MVTKADPKEGSTPSESQVGQTLRRKLMSVMASVDRLAKTGYNEAQKYRYVEASAVFEAIRTELVKVGVFSLVDVIAEDTTQYTTSKGAVGFFTHVQGNLTFMDADSDEQLIVEWRGNGADFGDKGLYKAITSGLKYALYGSFLIPTGDDVEASEPPVPAAPRAQAKVVGEGLTDAQRRLLFTRFEKAGLEGDQRKVLLFLATGKHSTKQMTSADMDTILGVLDDPTDAVNADFLESARMVQPITGPSPDRSGEAASR